PMPSGPPTEAEKASPSWRQRRLPLKPSSPARTPMRPLNSKCRTPDSTSRRVSQSGMGGSSMPRCTAQPASRSATRTPAARSGRRGERTLADPLQHLVLREELLRFLELVARFLRPAELPQHLDDVRRNLGVLEDFPRAPELYQRFVELA